MAQEKPGIMALLSPPISVKLGDITGWPSFSPSLSPSHPEACQRALAFYPSSSPHLHCHQSSPINLCFQLCGCNILLSSLPASALDLLQSNFHSAVFSPLPTHSFLPVQTQPSQKQRKLLLISSPSLVAAFSLLCFTTKHLGKKVSLSSFPTHVPLNLP